MTHTLIVYINSYFLSINKPFPSLWCRLAGHLSLSLINPMKSTRNKRNANQKQEIEDYMKVRTKYSLSVRNQTILEK